MKPEIYKMKLHDTAYTDTFVITRVAGGWIYKRRSSKKQQSFVPYNKEFYSNENLDT